MVRARHTPRGDFTQQGVQKKGHSLIEVARVVEGQPLIRRARARARRRRIHRFVVIPVRLPQQASPQKKAGRFCCRVRPKPRPTPLKEQGLKVGLTNCVKQPVEPQRSCHWQLSV